MHLRPRTSASTGKEPDPATGAHLSISDLRVEFADHAPAGGTPPVDGLDLTVRSGRIVALVGESGSGKSLTAHAVTGLLPAGAHITAGRITLDDEDLAGCSAGRMNHIRGNQVAMLFQQPKASLDPTATVRSQVVEPLWLRHGLSRRQARARAEELLHDVGIADPDRVADSYAHQLSGGMAQRVMIASALAGDPGLLIADEPTTALDVTVQAQILALLRRKQRERGLSVLLITHDLGIVASLADRVAVMYAGHIVEESTTQELFTDPQHPYTRALLRASLLRSEDGRLFAIEGSTAQSRGLDHGCRFRPRCPVAEELGISHACEDTEPTLHTCGADHSSRCWASPSPDRMVSA
ncbi:ABC transporter ATP-binding protein [Streptomyces antnestii]|uniref:ABC transporter ATP-binding protein n=1 Tax=Streptomyces antnestii TaxID=2494256 RepID=A0A3S2XU79_9ACTN|nr:ABC transporter ATP-binding protein [Streptomyces sp. San01]RVU23137.1 ABC transporter ATP-binding protein [Streptomyces sp. San01]